MTLALLPISRSAPQGAHTAKSNLVRPSAAHRSRKRRGGRAAGLGVRKSRKTENCTYFRENTCNLHVFLRKSNVYANNTKSCDLAALRPIPPPFPAREGCEGSRIRCGGEPLRRDGGFSHRSASFYWADPYRTAHRTRSAYKGPQAASRIHHPRTGGARGRGGTRGTGRREGCGVWGGLSGPGPAVRAAREAAGGARPPGGYPGGSSSGPRPLHA